MESEQHSNYDIVKNGKILFVDVQDIFDADIIKKYHQEMKAHTHEMKHQPWGSLIVYHGSGVFSPEAEEQIVDITKYRVKNNMVANATVILDSTHADVQQMQLTRIYSGCQLPFYVFTDVQSAENWLHDYLDQQPKAG